VFADEQPSRDLAVGEAGRDERQHLGLAPGQARGQRQWVGRVQCELAASAHDGLMTRKP
jgi:hypothetical protein